MAKAAACRLNHGILQACLINGFSALLLSTSPTEIDLLRTQNAQQAELIKTLQASNADLRQQLAWLNRELFGEKSEKRLNIDPAVQPSLLEGLVNDTPPPELPGKAVAEHTRKPKGPNAHEYEIIR